MASSQPHGQAERESISDLVRIDPSIKVTAVDMHPPPPPDYDELPSMDEVLNSLLGSPDIGSRLFDGKQTGCCSYGATTMLNLRNNPRRKLSG